MPSHLQLPRLASLAQKGEQLCTSLSWQLLASSASKLLQCLLVPPMKTGYLVVIGRILEEQEALKVLIHGPPTFIHSLVTYLLLPPSPQCVIGEVDLANPPPKSKTTGSATYKLKCLGRDTAPHTQQMRRAVGPFRMAHAFWQPLI